MDWAEAAYGDLAARRAEGRPYVAVNMVVSVDGAFAVEGRTAKLGSESDRDLFLYLRTLADVILVGAQTVRAERYGPPKVAGHRQEERAARGQAPVPRIAIVSRGLELDWAAPLFHTPASRPIVIAPASADPGALAAAGEMADVIVAGEIGVDMAAALGHLGELGAQVVLCEGGPTLNGALAEVGLIDELCLTVAPTFVGGRTAGILGGHGLGDLVALDLVHTRVRDGDVFLRYRRPDRPAAEPAPVEPDVDVFEAVVAELDYPMMIVTATAADGERSGCLVSFGTQASISPGRYAVLLSKANHTYGVALRADVLTVHFPSVDDRALVDLFGGETGDEVDKFAECRWGEGPGGAAVLADLVRWFTGSVVDRIDMGDHVAFVLAPIAGQVGSWSRQLGFQDVRGLPPGHPPDGPPAR